MVKHEEREGGNLHILTVTSGGKPLRIYVAEPGKYNLGKSRLLQQVAAHQGHVLVNGVEHLGHNHRPMTVEEGQDFALEVLGPDQAVIAVLDHGGTLP